MPSFQLKFPRPHTDRFLMGDETFSPEQAMQGLAVLSAIPVVLLALWADYFGHFIESQVKANPSFDRAPELVRVRSAGICAMVFQFVVFMTSIDVRRSYPTLTTLLFVGAIVVQAWIQASLDKKIRATMPTTALTPGSQNEIDQQAILKGQQKPLDSLARTLFWCAVGGALYVSTVLGTVAVFTLAARMLHASSGVTTFVVILGAILGVLGGLGINFALGSFHLRQMLPTKALENAELSAVFDESFKRADLRSPSYWVIENDRVGQFNSSSAMVAGFKSGRGWFKPGLFVSRGAIRVLSRGELQAVVLHEVSHIKLGHLKKRMMFSFGLIVGTTFVATFFVLLAHFAFPSVTMTGIFGPVTALVSFFMTFRMLAQQSQVHELEADIYAIEKLGANLFDLTNALRKLSHANEPDTNPWSSHPPTESRIGALKVYFDRKAALENPVDSSRDRAA